MGMCTMNEPIILVLLVISVGSSLVYKEDFLSQLPKNSSCEMGSCYPATGNLLIGREKNLSATSTCGLYAQERYCIVSHLEGPKKCFSCDSRPGKENNPMLSHRIENIIYSNFPGTNQPSWWQSENGKENVSIQLDLEAEFHFTHLIMKFRTFRPRAMLIERSSDHGKTWKVYRYFAENCREAFPHASELPQRSITDVICDSRYSGAEPSNHGEVILRVISPSLQGTYRDPYSSQLQGLLKMTNLRINFTKLQTLGDDLVDTRDEIKEKYYYAVKEMTVRGSCWCYGHAQSCLPVEGVEDRNDMVHGRCNCTHNTQGLNCEKCADAYNDVPWAPAIGRKTNACRACNCNGHTDKCEFNEEVFIRSGRVSGGVCTNCKHNTKGKNCEQCGDSYYLSPYRDITDFDACIPCECILDGSADGGLCDPKTDFANGLDAGRCHCKVNVQGRLCDTCKPGFWNFNGDNPDGCEACQCDPDGSVNGSSVCDSVTGKCVCKSNVTGRNCNQCLPQHWGLETNPDGCQPCECTVGGSLYSDCDVISGDCKCRPNIVGRRCDKPQQGFFVPTPRNVYEAENSTCLLGECRVEIREPPRDGSETPWTGSGFMRVFDNTGLEFNVNNIEKPNEYDIVIRYESQSPEDWTEAEILVVREETTDPNSICANVRPEDDQVYTILTPDTRHVVGRPICLEADKNYKIIIKYKLDGNNQVDSPTASILIDSIVLIPKIDSLPFFKETVMDELRKQEYDRLKCQETLFSPYKNDLNSPCSKFHYSVSVVLNEGATECECDATGSLSALCEPQGGDCSCKQNIVGRRCDKCSPGTYGFGPQGCKACDCDSVGAYNNICNATTGQCSCKAGTYGRTCGECEPGAWNFPNCQPCECNGHAHICNSYTGECIDCEDATTGHYCERCEEGYYGDPRIGSGIQCKACQCPGIIESGHSFAPRCILNPTTQDVVCECNEGYSGARCEVCADNYYGNPEEVGGSCKPCECNDNIDLSAPGNCDRQSGKCLRCEHFTTGDHCEICKPGFYGDALQQTCQACNCDFLGTDPSGGACNPGTGQCPCLPNVEGRNCSECKANYWKIASGQGCEQCNCDMKGSLSEFCNMFTGNCECKEGFGGRQCNHCKEFFFGDPNVECFPCVCNVEGSVDLKCNEDNGSCVCKEGIGGEHCDQCARGWYGTFPQCQKCGECFDNWDITIDNLKGLTNDVIKSAGEIKRTGATGAYNLEFEAMTQKVDFVKSSLNNTKVNKANLDSLNRKISSFKVILNESTGMVNENNEKSRNVLTNISDANFSLQFAHNQVQILKQTAEVLNENATNLQEKDLKGALDLTRQAGMTSNEVNNIEKRTKKLLNDAERNCTRAEKLLNQENDTFSDKELVNEHKRHELEFVLSQLEEKIPDLNNKVCDGRTTVSNHCDSLCGGAGCNRCGGISCKLGAVGKASGALEFAKDTDKNIYNHTKDAEKTFRMIEQARQETENANKAARNAQDEASSIKTSYDNLVINLSGVRSEVDEYINTPAADPDDIKQISYEVLNYSIPYEADKIKNLIKHIYDKIALLKNVDKISDETKDDQLKTKEYKQRAEAAKFGADEIKKKAEQVVDGLTKTKTAQEEVNEIIVQANNSILSTKKDLAQIASELSDAEQKTNENQIKIQELQTRFKKLQTGMLKNEHDANQALKEGERVNNQVKVAGSEADELIRKYNQINEDLKVKSNIYKLYRTKTQRLKDKAQLLSGTAKSKQGDLKEFSNKYEEQENILKNLAQEIKELLARMSEYSVLINNKTEYYRTCLN